MRFALFSLAAAILLAPSSFAQRRVDLLIDFEGVHRAKQFEFEPNVVRYEPQFDDGGGIGGAVNIFFTGRISLELKVAGLASHLQVRRTGSDFVAIADVGYAQIYPITAVVQWHLNENGAIRPYLGAGVGYVVLKNVEKQVIGARGIEFDNPTGFVVDGGFLVPLSKRWSISADARYTPVETQAEAEFIGVTSARIDVRPLVLAFGLAYHF
jgi:outer membrane protein